MFMIMNGNAVCNKLDSMQKNFAKSLAIYLQLGSLYLGSTPSTAMCYVYTDTYMKNQNSDTPTTYTLCVLEQYIPL